MRIIAIALVALLLAGCKSTQMTPIEVNLASSDFCEIMKGRKSWDVADTKPTIDQIRKLNAAYDQRCTNKSKG